MREDATSAIPPITDFTIPLHTVAYLDFMEVETEVSAVFLGPLLNPAFIFDAFEVFICLDNRGGRGLKIFLSFCLSGHCGTILKGTVGFLLSTFILELNISILLL